ncbi:MAG: hypothetical protein ACRDTR_13805 [Rubrobacter sp.]
MYQMYQMNDVEVMREHRRELLAEAERNRLVRRLREARPKKEKSYAHMTRRRVALLLSR